MQPCKYTFLLIFRVHHVIQEVTSPDQLTNQFIFSHYNTSRTKLH